MRLNWFFSTQLNSDDDVVKHTNKPTNWINQKKLLQNHQETTAEDEDEEK